MDTLHNPSLSPWYVTGFVEGQGTFTFSRSNQSIALYFGIKLVGSDAAVLERLQAFFGGIGRIYEQRLRTSGRRRTRSKTALYYRVTRAKDLFLVVEHFDKYPLAGSKLESFQVWKEMVALKNACYGRPPLDRLEALAQQLTSASARHHPPQPDP